MPAVGLGTWQSKPNEVREAVKGLVEQARTQDPEASYRSVIGEVLDYRTWHEMRIYLRRPGRNDELLTVLPEPTATVDPAVYGEAVAADGDGAGGGVAGDGRSEPTPS